MLVILSGVSGAGKDTIKKELIKRMKDVISLPSYTSRQPRPGEEDGDSGFYMDHSDKHRHHVLTDRNKTHC